MILAQALINGLLIGSVWAILGLGKQIVLGVIHFVNFAHGHFVLIGMYASWFIWSMTHVDPFLLVPVVALVSVVLALVMDRLMVRPLVVRGDRSQMIATLALTILVESTALILVGPDPESISTWWSKTAWNPVPGLYLNYGQLMSTGIAVVVFFVTWWLVRKTKFGVMVRATSQNRESAQYMGVNTTRIYTYAFVLSIVLAGIVGSLLIVNTPVDPQSGWTFLIIMFVVPILGGMGSIPGTAIAGVVVGMAQVISTTYLDVQLQNGIVYVLFIGFLILRPQGILGSDTDQVKISI